MEKIKVGILGATGTVGQRFVMLLENHPFFQVTALAASERSAGKKYGELMQDRWKFSSHIPAYVKDLTIKECKPSLDCKIVFSGLDASVAGDIETAFAQEGYIVVSNAKNHRYDDNVPILSAEVNPEHLDVVKEQGTKGFIITNSNCTVMGPAMVVKALHDAFGVEQVSLVSMQAISGAGYPGVSSLDITDNVIPFISGEEEKVEKELIKTLGKVKDKRIVDTPIAVSAQCNRVNVVDGHTVCLSIKFDNSASIDEVKEKLQNFKGIPQALELPSAPEHPIVVRDEVDRPQPRLDRMEGNGMSVVVGRIRKDPLFDVKMVVLTHNTIRGAAGAAVLNAELLVKKGFIGKH